jgi:hypothetical protein
MSYTGAGIIPFSYFNNTMYFLLGREHKETGWPGSEKLSDFGGSVEEKHKSPATLNEFGAELKDYPMISAATEFWEETMGLFFPKKEVFKMLKNQNSLVVKSDSYAEYFLQLTYNPYWAELYRNAHNYILSCAVPHPSKTGYMYIPSCPEGYVEKTEVIWISYDDLKAATETTTPTQYRPDFLKTMKIAFSKPEFAALLANASIFIDPNKKGFFAPIVPEPIIPVLDQSKWPSFYPQKNMVTKSLITDLKSQYSFLLASLPAFVKKPELVLSFNYIDQVNQFNFEVKSFIYNKAVPGAQPTPSPIIPKVYWVNKYCPLEDKTLTNLKIGAGSNGVVHLISGPMTKCCSKSLRFAVKSVHKLIDTTQFKDVILDTNKSDSIVPSKKILTDIFVTECAASSIVNHLAMTSICYNVPYFYGAASCQTNSTTYMYMQLIENKFSDNVDSSTKLPEINSLMLQGLMTLYAFYKVKLVHGDINELNLAFNLLDPGITKRPFYIHKGSYYVSEPTNKILYFIDYGMAFIKNKLEPAERISKDKSRHNNNVNWLNSEKTGVIKGHAYEAYKGYYVSGPEFEDAAYIRRHLLDIYLLFDTFTKTFGLTKVNHLNHIKDYVIKPFSNPFYFSKNPEKFATGITTSSALVETMWNTILQTLPTHKITAGSLEVLNQDQFEKLNPSDLMFLGNLDQLP